MEATQKKRRGLDLTMRKIIENAIEKENHIRMQWFKVNEQRLRQMVEEDADSNICETLQESNTEQMKEFLKSIERKPRKIYLDQPPDSDQLFAITDTMKLVDPTTTRLLYTATQKDGAQRYLTERYKILPEDRYYCTETSNFEYGWKMWNCAKEMSNSKYGRQQVIKTSFYRRRAGIVRNPDWYKEPDIISTKVCDCV